MELRKQEVQGEEEVCSCRGSAIGSVVFSEGGLAFLYSVGVQAKASDRASRLSSYLAVSNLVKLDH